MTANAPDRIYNFDINGQSRAVVFKRTIRTEDGIVRDVYSCDGNTHTLIVTRVTKGFKTPFQKILIDDKITEGFLQGKGTLTVYLENGTKNFYYFETEGYNKEIEVHVGQTIQWSAPHDTDLVFYEISDSYSPAPSPPPPPLPKAVPIEPPPKAKSTAKLFLSSVAITGPQAVALANLVGKRPQDIKLALIENAADVEANSESWVAQNRKAIQSHGFSVDIVNLKSYGGNHVALLKKLASKHVIWLGGGHTFYLRWLLRESRADLIIKDLVRKGVVYGGGSAGAIVAGPTLKYFDEADDPKEAPEIILEGLNLTDTVIVPHMDNEKFKLIVSKINKQLKDSGFKTAPLNDAQALIINGDEQKVI